MLVKNGYKRSTNFRRNWNFAYLCVYLFKRMNGVNRYIIPIQIVANSMAALA